MKNIHKLALLAYIVAGVLSFGHAYNRPWKPYAVDSGASLLASLAIGATWPLYVSVVIFEK